jgi:hypothetical protein
MPDRVAEVQARFSSKKIKEEPEKVGSNPKAEVKKETKPEKKEEPKEKKMPMMWENTIKGVHDKVQSRRYGSYREISKSAASFITFSVLAVHGHLFFAIPFGILAGYYFSNYQTDHSKYGSWSKRPAIVPDVTLLDKRSQPTIRFDKVYDVLSPADPPTIVD